MGITAWAPGQAFAPAVIPIPVDLDIQRAFLLTGVNFANAGPRVAPTKTAGVDALPAGVTLDTTNKRIRVTSGTTATLTGWDLSGFTVYMDQASTNLTLVDCRLAIANQRHADIRDGATFTAQWCEFDGLNSVNNPFPEMIAQSAMNSVVTVTDCRLHGAQSDIAKSGSGFTFDRNWCYDSGYGIGAHFDFIQTTLGAGGAGENIVNQTVRKNFFDGRKMNNTYATCAGRFQAEKGTNVIGVTFTGNVYLNPNNPDSAALYLGVRNDGVGSDGLSAKDYVIADNWMECGSGVYSNPAIPVPTGATAWYNNKLFSSEALISNPAGWASSVTPAPTPLPYTLIYDFETLNGATGLAGAVVSLDTSSRKAKGAAALRIQANGASTNIGTNAFFVTTFDFSTVDTVAICTDFGDFPSNDLLDVRWSTSLGHVLRSPASGASINAPFSVNALGKVWTTTTVDNYRRVVSYNSTSYTSGSNVVAMAVTGGLSVGMYVFNANFPAGTTITAINGLNLTMSNPATASGTATSITFSLSNDARGQSIKDLGAASKSITFGVTGSGNSSFTPDVVIDCMAGIPNDFLPEVHITFDDANVTQFDNRSIFDQFGIKFNVCTPWRSVESGSSKFTWANLATLKAEGHGVAIDSEGQDWPITKYPTLAQAIATMVADRTEIVNRVGATGNALETMCYSYGNMGYTAAPKTYTCTSDGATKSLLTFTTGGSTPVFTDLAPGMRAFISGAVVGIVEELMGQTTLKLDRQLAAGSYSITFSARVFSVTATCNGTTTVGLSSTANLFAGMHLLANPATGLQADTRIVSVDSATQITVDKAVPSTVTKLEFGYVDGEYWPTKVMKALYDAGFRVGRLVGPKNGALFTGFGPSPYQMLQWGPLVADNNTTTDATILQLQQNALEKRDTLLYGHNIQPSDIYNGVLVGGTMTYVPANGINPNAHWPKLLGAIKALIDAGKVRPSRHMGLWWAEVSQRLPPS